MRKAVGSFIGAALVVACCAGIPLIIGALGGVALGALLGVGGAALAGALLVVVLWRSAGVGVAPCGRPSDAPPRSPPSGPERDAAQ